MKTDNFSCRNKCKFQGHELTAFWKFRLFKLLQKPQKISQQPIRFKNGILFANIKARTHSSTNNGG
jgi:hypothetical protein